MIPPRLMGWDQVTAWTAARVRELAADTRVPDAPDLRLFEHARSSVGGGLEWLDAPADVRDLWESRVAPAWPRWAGVVGRYLAARVHGSWALYAGMNLGPVRQAVDVARVVLQVEAVRACAERAAALDASALEHAIRRSDLLLVHYADPDRLHAPVGDGEEPPVPRVAS
ncbi:MAG: hypothetical protein R2712_25635 [Vicinamibacterales bacterium]